MVLFWVWWQFNNSSLLYFGVCGGDVFMTFTLPMIYHTKLRYKSQELYSGDSASRLQSPWFSFGQTADPFRNSISGGRGSSSIKPWAADRTVWLLCHSAGLMWSTDAWLWREVAQLHQTPALRLEGEGLSTSTQPLTTTAWVSTSVGEKSMAWGSMSPSESSSVQMSLWSPP